MTKKDKEKHKKGSYYDDRQSHFDYLGHFSVKMLAIKYLFYLSSLTLIL